MSKKKKLSTFEIPEIPDTSFLSVSLVQIVEKQKNNSDIDFNRKKFESKMEANGQISTYPIELEFIIRGLDLDNSICKDFERKTKHKNYIFSNGIDFIYEYFNYENKINNSILSKTVKYIGRSKVVNKYFKKFADNGINI